MDYGWIFIMILLGLAILFQFGFFENGLFGNMNCRVPNGFVCKSPSIDVQEASFVLENRKLGDIQLLGVSLLSDICSSTKTFEHPVTLQNAEGYKVIFSCTLFPRKVEGIVEIRYRNMLSGLVFTDKGKIRFVS